MTTMQESAKYTQRPAMANATKKLPCGCEQGFYHCPTAVFLWADANAMYEVGKQTGEYARYDNALIAYRSHFPEAAQ